MLGDVQVTGEEPHWRFSRLDFNEACTTKVEPQNGALLGESCVVEFLAVRVLQGEMRFQRQRQIERSSERTAQ